MNDPVAFFITGSTYGTWLPGDERGWVEYMRGWKLPDPIRKLEAEAKPKKVRIDLKAWCTRRLKESVMPRIQENWWAERGSIRWVFSDDELARVVYYVEEAQDRKRESPPR